MLIVAILLVLVGLLLGAATVGVLLEGEHVASSFQAVVASDTGTMSVRL